MSCEECFRAAFIVVAMVTAGVLSNTPASEVCGDETGYACMFKSNTREFSDVPVHFDKAPPSWLTGTLIRNGLGMFERGQQSVTHAFDGFAKLASWRFHPNGTAFFSTQFIKSGFYNDTMGQKDHLAEYMMFNPPSPPFTSSQKTECMKHGLDNMNINVYDFPENHSSDPGFAAFSDFWNIYEFSGRELSTKGLIKPKLASVQPSLHLNLISSGHPLREPGTTNLITFLVGQKMMSFLDNRLSIVRMSSVTGRSLIAEWSVKENIPYMHSFSVTQTKVVLLTGPLVEDADTKCVLENAAPLPCMKWYSDKPSTLYIADLKTGHTKVINMTSSIFAIHHINAYDVGDKQIVMDVVSYDSFSTMKEMLLMDIVLDENKRNEMYGRPINKRMMIDLPSNTVEMQDLSTDNVVTDGLDMPAINENYRSKKYCYVYGMNNFADGKRFISSAIIKKDVCNGGKVVRKLFFPGHYPVEPAFVPNPKGTAEDDGVLLVPILRGADAVTYLAVVDASTLTIVSKADMPDYVPFSLHGRFFEGFY